MIASGRLTRKPIRAPPARAGGGRAEIPTTKPIRKRLQNAPSSAARRSGNVIGSIIATAIPPASTPSSEPSRIRSIGPPSVGGSHSTMAGPRRALLQRAPLPHPPPWTGARQDSRFPDDPRIGGQPYGAHYGSGRGPKP